jgi:hypothetical protein
MYFHVILGSKHIDLVMASSSEEAIQIIELKFGLASNYSKTHSYKAMRA